VLPVCYNRNIRYFAELGQLANCGVIEGFLVISAIFSRTNNEWNFDGLEFPLLTEVTEFVAIYRVRNLKSLGKLFPNLRVIRGNQLIHEYSFVVYGSIHLQVKEKLKSGMDAKILIQLSDGC